MRRLTLFIFSLMLVAFAANAQTDKAPTRDDAAIPLRNWAVSFERGGVTQSPSGKFVPTVNTIPTNVMTFVAIAPCRVLDTRNANQGGGGKFLAGAIRTYNIPNLYQNDVPSCGVLPAASAYSLNFSIAGYSGSGSVSAWPADQTQPTVSILNLGSGKPLGNAAIVGADASGNIKVALSNIVADPGTTHVIIDINGYFVENATSANVANTIVKRDVNGDFQAGTITATKVLGAVYQDMAEWVPSSSELRPGMVVVLDPADGRRVLPSSHAYDTGVAGVVSENPGIVLGTSGPEKSQIATTGRVRVFVDADAAPIRVGDLLVTSNTPGVAMRSTPMSVDGQTMHRPGTIIGKAMQPLASGRGEIMVLLSLQ